jgi:hypothetical protein
MHCWARWPQFRGYEISGNTLNWSKLQYINDASFLAVTTTLTLWEWCSGSCHGRFQRDGAAGKAAAAEPILPLQHLTAAIDCRHRAISCCHLPSTIAFLPLTIVACPLLLLLNPKPKLGWSLCCCQVSARYARLASSHHTHTHTTSLRSPLPGE